VTDLFIPGLTDPDAVATVRRHGHSGEAATRQAEAVFDQLEAALAASGGTRADVCKITMHITDRAWRQPVYGVLGKRLSGVFPVSTGLIVNGLAHPDALFQLDAYAVHGGPHERFRRYRSGDAPYGLHKQSFSMEFCMAVRAGRRVFLRGQTGSTLDRRFPHLNDPAAQAHQAIANVQELLRDAGADLSHATRLVAYVTDRAYLEPVLAAVLPAFPAPPACTELMVKGLAAPELLMEIDVHATLPGPGPAATAPRVSA